MYELGIFAKHWQAGQVKTRLAASLGAERAAELYRVFVETLLVRQADCGDRRVLAFTPSDRRAEFARLVAERQLSGAWRLEPQAEGDLGVRMHHFFTTAFGAGATRVVLLGSDSPNLPKPFVEQAFGWLDEVPIVLGPTYDGGYYLIAARRDAARDDGSPRLLPFEGIPWSSDSVWRETTAQLDAAGCPYRVLPKWYDVDDLDDLACLASDLATEREDASLEGLRKAVLAALSPDSDLEP